MDKIQKDQAMAGAAAGAAKAAAQGRPKATKAAA